MIMTLIQIMNNKLFPFNKNVYFKIKLVLFDRLQQNYYFSLCKKGISTSNSKFCLNQFLFQNFTLLIGFVLIFVSHTL